MQLKNTVGIMSFVFQKLTFNLQNYSFSLVGLTKAVEYNKQIFFYHVFHTIIRLSHFNYCFSKRLKTIGIFLLIQSERAYSRSID